MYLRNSYLITHAYNIKRNPLVSITGNVKTIDDIWSKETKSFHAGNIIFGRLADKRNWIAEYAMIKNAIPNDWKKILKNENTLSYNDEMQKNTVILEIKDCSIFINGNEILLRNLQSRDIYFSLL